MMVTPSPPVLIIRSSEEVDYRSATVSAPTVHRHTYASVCWVRAVRQSGGRSMDASDQQQ